MEIGIPYGDGNMLLDVPGRRVKAVLAAREDHIGETRFETGSWIEGDALDDAGDKGREERIVLNALANPIGSLRLCELAGGKHRITIITSDHTRPMPSRITMPLLLDEIRKGSPDAEILILVATGMHRATTDEELRERFGEDIFKNEKIIVHDCRDDSSLRGLGRLPSGGSLVLSRYALDADLLIAEGFIEPHFFAGFSGGRKSILPGVAGYECVVSNHSSVFIANENARAGILDENPIHRDMVFAAEKAGLAFILNVVLNKDRVISDAVAGDPALAHAEGCARLGNKVKQKSVKAPIVITSNGGYPLDQNLYQLVKCMETAGRCCEDGGVIIAVGECRDGAGSEDMYNDFAGGAAPGELTELYLSRKPAETKTDQWQSQILARLLEKYRVIVVAPLIEEIVKEMGLVHADDLEEALVIADGITGCPGAADIVVIPDGIGVIVE